MKKSKRTAAPIPQRDCRRAKLYLTASVGLGLEVPVTADLPFGGDVEGLLKAAEAIYPKRRPTSYFVGLMEKNPHLTSLTLQFGNDRAGNRVHLNVELKTEDVPSVAAYLIAKTRMTDVSLATRPAPASVRKARPRS